MEDELMLTPAQRKASQSRFSRVRGGAISDSFHKSLLLLDEAMNTTPTLNTTHGRHTFQTSGIPSYTPDRTLLDLDNTLYHDVNLTQFEKRRETSSLKDDVQSTISTTAFLLQEDDAIMGVSAKLSDEFHEAISSMGAESQVFQLLQEFEDLCTKQYESIRSSTGLPDKSTRFRRSVHARNILRNERNTWRLLRTLYHDRTVHDNTDVMMPDNANQPRWSEKQIIQQLYEGQSHIRQAQIVIDWLEKNAAEDITEDHEKMEYFTDGSVAWENTLKRLQQHNKTTVLGRQPVTELDPDAPTRQNKPLDDLDQDDEERLLKNLFTYIRAGNTEEAQRLCLRVGQAWRAGSLEGWIPYDDPNYCGVGHDGRVQPTEGNPTRHIWKAACHMVSNDNKLSVYERAIYAALSGHLQNLLPACRSWEDYLWAYYRAMVETEVERELQTRSPASVSHFTDWGKTLTPDLIFCDLAASDNVQVRQHSQNQYHLIQRYIILDDIPGLVDEFHHCVKQSRDQLSSHLVRMMAHLILFFRAIGRSCREDLANQVLEAYVLDLIKSRQQKLLAFYVASLPELEQVSWYARFLEEVEDPEERQVCLELARQARLDVSLITKAVVENVRSKKSENLGGNLNAVTTEEDLKMISALDWLVFDPSQRAELLRQVNAIVRTFVVCRKLDAAREAFQRVPADAIDVLTKTWQMKTGAVELPFWQRVAVREYLCLRAYVQAHDAFSDWFEHYHHGKPAAPQLPTRSSFTERVAHEHREQQYQAEYDRWLHTLELQTKSTVDRLYNVLLFVDGGWLVDPETTSDDLEIEDDDEEEDSGRRLQLERLRGLCLPQVAMLLHTVLHTTERYQQCFHLADVIAAEEHQIFKVFSKEQLRQFMTRIQESSLKLIDKSHDGLGFNRMRKD